jgi:hypothetical protein
MVAMMPCACDGEALRSSQMTKTKPKRILLLVAFRAG